MPSSELHDRVTQALETQLAIDWAPGLITAIDLILADRLASLGGHLLNAGKAELTDAGTPAGLARAQARASIGAALLDHYAPKVAQ